MTATSVLFALFVVAQAGDASQPAVPAATTSNPAPQVPCAPGQLVAIAGTVKDQVGTPVPGAMVLLENIDTGARLVVGTGHRRDPATGAELGKFCSGAIPLARYRVTVEKSGFVRQQQGEVDLRRAAASSHMLDFVLYAEVAPASGSTLFALLGAVFLYLASIWLVRWYNVAWPARGPLLARLSTLKVRLNHEPGPDSHEEQQALLALVDGEVKKQETGWKFFDFLFWSRGQEQQAWMQIHDIEQRLIELLPDVPVERLKARLRIVEGELRATGMPEAIALADTARTTLAAAAPAPTPAELRAQLSEAVQVVHDNRDEKFWNLATWQNKATWLLLAGTGMVVAVALIAGRIPLLVAGASGGLLSRLVRAHRAQEVPSDYGASWPTLFFSPLLGALTGWFGVLLLVAFSSLDLLGAAFREVTWDNPLAPMTLAAAFLMGISERMFDGLVSAAERTTGVTRPTSTANTAGLAGVTLTDRPGGDPNPEDGGSGPAPPAAPEIFKVTPDKAAVGQEVTATGKSLSLEDIKKLFLVGADKQPIEASQLKAGGSGAIVFEVPKVPAGDYGLTLVDARDREHATSTPMLRVG